jgi:hypothetical protein
MTIWRCSSLVEEISRTTLKTSLMNDIFTP